MKITGEMFFYVSLIILLYFRYKTIKNKKSSIDKVKELMILLFGIYLLQVMSLVFFPITINLTGKVIVRDPIVWFNPLKSIIHIIRTNNLITGMYNIVGNIVLLLPLPIFLVYFLKEKVDNLIKMILICFLFSLGIEILQYIESLIIPSLRRYFELNDILLNTLGSFIGYKIYDRYIRYIIR